MLKEISLKEAEEMQDKGEIGRVLYLYTDGTEAYIDENVSHLHLTHHYKNGGKFAIEVENTNLKKKFIVEVEELYRWYTEVEAVNEEDAREDVYSRVLNDTINAPDDFKYDVTTSAWEIERDYNEGMVLDVGKIKTMLSVEILDKMNDESAANALRGILFAEGNLINWVAAYNATMKFMPELKQVDYYKVENMK